MKKTGLIWLLSLFLAISCVRTPHQPSQGHLDHKQHTAAKQDRSNIPKPVSYTPVVPEPQPSLPDETFSVVVTDVSLDQLMFALARDANINIDVHPGLSGEITLNAIDQTLMQILDRVSAQVAIRYHFEDDLLVIEPDKPYLRTYYIDYVNMARSSRSASSVSTQIATTGQSALDNSGSSAGGAGDTDNSNNSATSVNSSSQNEFWQHLNTSVGAMLGLAQDENSDRSVIVNSETGMLTVRATDSQHRAIREFLDRMMVSAQRQVLIEATVVEVELNDDFQLGVDWQRLADNGTGLSFAQELLGSNLADPPVSTLTYFKDSSTWGQITATVKALQEFGNVKVLSSPKIMAINNQTALLKVVDNLVYFTIEADTVTNQTNAQTTFTTTPHTVPVGFVMSVTPQVSREQAVILHVRPTISRVTSFVEDPNPALAADEITSLIPQIQVREMESILRVRSGQIAVLGGLIQDSAKLQDQGLPWLMETEIIGDAFAYQNNNIKKSELVIFLRPRVVASIDQPLNVYEDLIPDPNQPLTPRRARDRRAWN